MRIVQRDRNGIANDIGLDADDREGAAGDGVPDVLVLPFGYVNAGPAMGGNVAERFVAVNNVVKMLNDRPPSFP